MSARRHQACHTPYVAIMSAAAGCEVAVTTPERPRPPAQVRIGPGLQQRGGVVMAIRPGVVRTAANGKVWLDSRQRRWAFSPPHPPPSRPRCGEPQQRQHTACVGFFCG